MSKKIEIRKSKIKKAGRGVFATADIKKGETIEVCPTIIFSEDDYPHLQDTKMISYIYGYGQKGNKTMMALGFGSLYNHHNTPNAKYELLADEGVAEQDVELYFTAMRLIKKDEEIYINYGGEYNKMYKPK